MRDNSPPFPPQGKAGAVRRILAMAGEQHHPPEDNTVHVKVALFFLAVIVVIALIGVLN
jgi:hypothetical protein